MGFSRRRELNFQFSKLSRQLAKNGFENRGKIASKSVRRRSDSAFEAFLKMTQKSISKSMPKGSPIGGHMGAKVESTSVKTRSHFQEGPWGTPGTPLGAFWNHFKLLFGFFWGVHLQELRLVGDLKRTSEIGSRERSPCVRKRFGSSSRPISGRPARQRFTQRDHTRPLRNSACICTGSH